MKRKIVYALVIFNIALLFASCKKPQTSYDDSALKEVNTISTQSTKNRENTSDKNDKQTVDTDKNTSSSEVDLDVTDVSVVEEMDDVNIDTEVENASPLQVEEQAAIELEEGDAFEIRND